MIEKQTLEVLKECSHGSVAGTLTFPEVVKKLGDVGVEFYYADLYQRQKIYYFPDGRVHTEAEQELDSGVFGAHAVAQDLAVEQVKSAILKIQHREIKYQEFLRLILAAGVATYSVYLDGKRAMYTGRKGDAHVEWFPGAK